MKASASSKAVPLRHDDGAGDVVHVTEAERLAWAEYRVAALIHAAVIVSVGLSAQRLGSLGGYAGWLFVAGVVIFSGSLYALSISGIKILGAITPIGGLFLLAGWAALAAAALKTS